MAAWQMSRAGMLQAAGLEGLTAAASWWFRFSTKVFRLSVGLLDCWIVVSWRWRWR